MSSVYVCGCVHVCGCTSVLHIENKTFYLLRVGDMYSRVSLGKHLGACAFSTLVNQNISHVVSKVLQNL